MKIKKNPSSVYAPPIVLTEHAQVRLQQRGIAKHWIPLIIEYGKEIYDHHGAVRYFMTSRLTRNVIELMRGECSIQQLEKLKGVYVIVSADNTTVITAAHKY